jgi:8-oxo-dGTP diphosphatase
MSVKITTVTCAIIEKEGKILIARRAIGQKLAGKWEFPGGKVEDGESPEECLKRELEEEFGIKVEVGEFITSNKHHYDHISIELLAFQVKFISGEFTLTDHDTIEWVVPEELLNYDLAAADVPIAREIINYVGGNTRS